VQFRKTGHIIATLFILTLLLSCGGNDGVETLKYKFKTIDIMTGEILSDVDINMSYNLGGTYSMGSAEGISDQNGELTLELEIDLDSVQVLLEETDYLDESNINHPVYAEKDGYVIIEIDQDSATYWFRPQLRDEETTIVKLMPYQTGKLTITDVPPLVEQEHFFLYNIKHSHPNFSFPYFTYGQIEIFYPQQETQNEVTLIMGDGADYEIEYWLTKLDTVTMELDSFFHSVLEYSGDFSTPSPTYELTF